MTKEQLDEIKSRAEDDKYILTKSLPDGLTHLFGEWHDYTVCGIATAANDESDFELVSSSVDCPDCLYTINICLKYAKVHVRQDILALIEAVEQYQSKAEPKNVVRHIHNSRTHYRCPQCDYFVGDYNYCSECGQRLDWEVNI
jgi:hypothetical protein